MDTAALAIQVAAMGVNATPITIEKAKNVEQYLTFHRISDLKLSEVIRI